MPVPIRLKMLLSNQMTARHHHKEPISMIRSLMNFKKTCFTTAVMMIKQQRRCTFKHGE